MAVLSIFAYEVISIAESLTLPSQAGEATIGQVRLEVGPFSLTLDNPQWGFNKGARYLEQIELATPYGVLYRHPYGLTVYNYTEVRFARTDDVIEALRAISHYAGRTGERVYVVLDMGEAPDVWWYVDWPTEMTFKRIIENREEVVLTLQQQSEGVPA